MEYLEQISSIRNFGIDDMVNIAKANLEERYRKEPWTYTDHGRAIISDEQQLYAYLTAYGEMHKYKCYAAMHNTDFASLPYNLEIVDWGCGQGVATVCMIEFLRKNDVLNRLKKVTLIEPSAIALERAELNVRKALNDKPIPILKHNKFLPSDIGSDDVIDSLDFTGAGVLHLFSNILDLTSVSLKKTAQLITKSPKEHFIYTISPVNANSGRLDEFCSYFKGAEQFSDICQNRFGYTSDTQHVFSCKTKCVRFTSSGISSFDNQVKSETYSAQNTYDDYDRSAYVRNGLLSAEFVEVYEKILKHLHRDDKLYIKPEINGDCPDLVIVRKDSGLLIVNLFEEDITDYWMDRNGIYINEDRLSKSKEESPIARACDYIDGFHSFHMSTVASKNVRNNQAYYLIKATCIFPKNTKDEINSSMTNYSDIPSNVRLVGQDDLSIEDDRTFWDTMNLTYNSSADINVYEEFCSLLSTKWHSCTEGEPIELSPVQKDLIESVPGAKKIKGVAGSGKTQVLVSRAVNANKRTGKKVLILTFNITLISYIKYRLNKLPEDFLWDNFVILNYHSFFKIQARNHSRHVYLSSFDDTKFFENIPLQKYSTILIDEVQDYTTDWLDIVTKYFLEKGGELVLFGDVKQNIYHRETDSNEVKTHIRGPWISRLNKGFRFSNKLFTELAVEFQKEFFSESNIDEIETGLFSDQDGTFKYYSQGITPEKLYGNWLWLKREFNLDESNTVVLAESFSVLRKFEQDYRTDPNNSTPPMITFETQEELNILVREYLGNRKVESLRRTRKVHFTMDTPVLKMSSIHSFKGWEADNVILLLQDPSNPIIRNDDFQEKIDNCGELIYTAITRARKNLFILNLGDQHYEKFFSEFENGTRTFW